MSDWVVSWLWTAHPEEGWQARIEWDHHRQTERNVGTYKQVKAWLRRRRDQIMKTLCPRCGAQKVAEGDESVCMMMCGS